jgi:enamine deaminase RidA (YjgF/YER057c/UK114 family)
MTHRRNVPAARIARHVLSGMHVTKLTHPSHTEILITAVPVAGRSSQAMLADVGGALRDDHAQIVSVDVFGIASQASGVMAMLSGAFGRVSWPVTWLDVGNGAKQGLGGVQVWAASGVSVEPLGLDARVVGSVFEVDGARYCRLGGLAPADPTEPPAQQARNVLERMEAVLGAAGLGFGDVLRTWFFNDKILDWYADFNRVRDDFFAEQRVSGGVVPASTGVGAPNGLGAALIGGLLAVKGKREAVQATAVPSPLQPPAMEYGSSFSRAVELVLLDCRQLFVSGTASIAPNGETVHVGDIDGQIIRTVDVVQAILSSRGMSWADVTRGVAYFKRLEDVPVFRTHCMDRRMEPLPIVCAQSTVCRDELLFELEVDAISTT